MKKFDPKKLFAGLSSAAIIAGTIPSAAPAVQAAETSAETVYGDANDDGRVSVADAVAILQFIGNRDKYNLSERGLDNADVYMRGDGVTARDALSIQMLDAGLIDSLPESWLNGQPDPDPVTDTVYIHLNGGSISVEGDNSGYTSVSGTVVTISHSGTFYIDGTLDDGQICVNVPDETADPETVKLFLNGVNITGKSDSAILISNAENTSINLVDGTVNNISDGDTPYASGNAVIEAKDDVTIKGGDNGSGVLKLTANTQDGIVCNNDIKFNGGVVDIETLNADDKTNAVNGKKSVTVKDGTITVDAEGDGIKSSKGNVKISGGSVEIKAGNDAIQSETTIDISGGSVMAGGDRGITPGTELNITGGSVVATATDYQVDTALMAGTTQGTMILNCIDDASNSDGCWKKANSIIGAGNNDGFVKKYKYALISNDTVKSGSTYELTNSSTGNTVQHSGGVQFRQTELITVYNEVNPAGVSAPVTPDPVDGEYTITLSSSGVETNAPSDVASVNNGVLTINKEGVFSVTGSNTGGQIVVDVDKTAYPDAVVELDLEGMSLTNTNDSPIYVAAIGDEVVISAKNGTENTISDGADYTNADGSQGAIYACDDLKIKGKGTLTVNGNAADGIVCKNDLKLYNGNITVNAADDGIRGKDSVTIGKESDTDFSNLNITVNTQGGDGIKSTATDTDSKKSYGLVTINGGTIDINSYADGIQAEQEFVMNGGDLNIYTYEGSNYTGTSSGNTGGNTGGRPGGMQDGNSNKTDISAKGIKAVGLYDEAGTTWQSKGDITINGGNITVDSSDDSLHCGGNMNLYGGVLTLSTADDGCHADHDLTIGKGSSTTYDDITIRVIKGYEGIEAQNITQNSGAVICNVTDDGYNAAGGSDGSGNGNQMGPGGGWGQGSWGSSGGNYSLTINGGFALVNVASGDHDGFDSNGSLTITGGIVVTNGNEPFDSDGTLSATGGIWIENSTCNSYMDTQPSYSVNGSSVNAGERISLVGSDGKVIVSFIAGKAVSKLRAGGNVSGAGFKIGGSLSGSTYFMDGEEAAYGGTVTGV